MNKLEDKSQPIRVLQVFHILNRGGAEAVIMNLYRKIDRSKVQFDFLVHSQDKGLYEDEIVAMGGRVFRLRPFKGYNMIPYYCDCRNFFQRHPEFRVVHGHLGSCAAYYLLAAHRAGCYTIAHSHSAGKIWSFRDAVYSIFSYPTRYVADSLWGCSTEAGIARFGQKEVFGPKYRNFRNAVDCEAFKFNDGARKMFRSEFNVDDRTFLIGAIGRITVPKNPPRIYEIFKRIVECNANVKCLWIGTGELESKYRDLIVSNHLQDRIIMTGLRSDIPHVMQGLDCMLFPSLWEGLPVSVIEAQAANLPVVLSDTISREVEISNLLRWHSLDEDDALWADDCIASARQELNRRGKYTLDISTSGYEISTTVKWLEDFYICKEKEYKKLESDKLK